MTRRLTRWHALDAIAAATGHRRPIVVREDSSTGFTTLRGDDGRTLDLIDVGLVRAPGVRLFDEVPSGPPHVAPEWRGFLVATTGPERRLRVVRLGERASIEASWPFLATRLRPVSLARLIARYHGRDAGLPVHHHVVGSASDVGDVGAADASVLEDLRARGTLRRPVMTQRDGAGTLSFMTAFLEAGPRETTVGLCRWVVEWRGGVLSWVPTVERRGIRSIYAVPRP